MQPSRAEVFEAALALPDEDRAKLAEKLIASLDGAPAPAAEIAWAAAIERRLARIDAGRATAIPMDEALARLRPGIRAAACAEIRRHLGRDGWRIRPSSVTSGRRTERAAAGRLSGVRSGAHIPHGAKTDDEKGIRIGPVKKWPISS